MIKNKARISFSFSPSHSIFVSSHPIHLIPYNPRSGRYAHRRKTCEPSSPGVKDEKASRDDDHHHDSREDHHDSRDDHQKPVSDGHRSPVRGSASISLCAHAEVQQCQLLAGCSPNGNLEFGDIIFCFRSLEETISVLQQLTSSHAFSGDMPIS